MSASILRPLGPRWGAISALALVTPSAVAQLDTFGPMGNGFRVSQSAFYDQIWCQVARTPTGYVFAWSEGQDILSRRYSLGLVPAGNDTLVNSTFHLEQQDEPAIAAATTGNTLIAWSERYGYDGEQMGIFGRIMDGSGAPLATEFRINQAWAASQWRPLIAPTPSGGFVVAWSGDWDGNAYFRVMNSTGAFQTGDVLINQYTSDAQVDPSVAVHANGTIFATFVDFSSHAGGSGLNLYGRLFDSSGAPLGNEFTIPSTFVNGDQRSPRVVVDGQGRFVVTWMSQFVDGSGYGIVARRYSSTGVALGPEFQVNTISASDQVEPVIAAEADGDFMIAWHDWSTGVVRIAGRRFDANAQPKGPDLVLANSPDVDMPILCVDPTGQAIVMAYQLRNGTDYDVYARAFQATSGPHTYCTPKTNSAGCAPSIAFAGTPSASSTSPFTISATNVINQKSGLLFYGYGSIFMPFQGGTLCLAAPMRTATLFSGGSATGTNCTGSFAYDFNARIQSGADAGLSIGRTVSAQFYYRDPPASFGAGLSNAVRFTIQP